MRARLRALLRRMGEDRLWLGCLLLFGLCAGSYFLLQFLPLEHHTVECALDRRIPFVPVFVVPYILWYVYVPLPLLYMSLTDKRRFARQAAALFPGILLCLGIFILWPSRVDLRPELSGEGGLFTALCRIIYAHDKPLNVFPSMHCFEALTVHLTTFSGGLGKRHPALRAGSGVLAALICLSTVFIKQHSVLDGLAGCALAVVCSALSGKLLSQKSCKKEDASS